MISRSLQLFQLWVFLDLWSISFHGFTAMAISENGTDLHALIAIKNQTNGLSSWNQSIHFCQWQGITCSHLHRRVLGLNLSGQGLVGKLPPDVGNLSFLISLQLQSNYFEGQIPEGIGRLCRLRHLNMSNNYFEGEIPANLTKCSGLRIVDFSWNRLYGRIPTELGSLSKLVRLTLGVNTLTGEMPPSLGNLSSLQILSVRENSLEGSAPDTLGRLSSLQNLLLQGNRLSGKVPSSLYNISSIITFSIEDNQLIGNLPADMGITLPELQYFTAGMNRLSGHLPVSLPNASRIQHFDIVGNNFTGQVPTALGILQNFQWINLADNYIGKGEAGDLAFISSLANSSNLRAGLSLSNNNFGGGLPKTITNLSTQIEKLNLGDNQISGVIPEGIVHLVNLISLGLENNILSGTIPSSIGTMQTLQVLFLQGNKLTGLIPLSLGNMSRLFNLSLADNRLEGRIPSSLGGSQSLQALSLAHNNLNGTIPEEVISNLSLSISLDLSWNSFTGSLPSAGLGRLKHLDFSGNKLSGVIPSSLGYAGNLERLLLGSNFFEGNIPSSFENFIYIQYMDLSNNKFSGQIPDFLGNFQYLTSLNLSFNNLEGGVPSKGIFENASAVSVTGNTMLCGGIQELHLTKCPQEYPQEDPQEDTEGSQELSAAFKIAIGLGVPLSLLCVASFLIIYLRKWPKRQAPVEPKRQAPVEPKNQAPVEPKRQALVEPKRGLSLAKLRHRYSRVSYKNLYNATGGFSTSHLIGSGRFGRVYSILKRNGTIVAVKVFNLEQEGASESFMVECESFRNLRHRNFVKIITSCCSKDFEGNDFKAIVFEFMSNGNLDKWLHRAGEGKHLHLRRLNLLQRLNIAVDIASALDYLHHQCHVVIIHRDLKPSNILLNRDMVAHVGDFGLAKFLPRSMESDMAADNGVTKLFEESAIDLHIFSRIKGSIGYCAPEYGMGGEASIHGDAYSYGILLLEMFTGKRPTNEIFKEDLNLHNYASKALPDQILQIVDPFILCNEPAGGSEGIRNQRHQRSKLLKCLCEVIQIGIACSVESPVERMDMRDVARKLHTIRDSFVGTTIQEETYVIPTTG